MKQKYIFIAIAIFLTKFPSIFAEKFLSSDKIFFSNTPTTINLMSEEEHKLKNLAIFDTSKHDAYIYQPTINIMKDSGFNVSYHPVDKLLDATDKKLNLNQYDVIFFVISPEIIKSTLQSYSHTTQKILNLIKQYSLLPNKIVALMLPPLRLNIKDPSYALHPIFDSAGINFMTAYKKNNTDLLVLKQLVDRFLTIPLECRSITYHTTLSTPNLSSGFKASQNINKKFMSVAMLPINQNNICDEAKAISPFGMYFFNKEKRNHVIISSASLLSFAGISENFKLCPMSPQIKEKMLASVNQMLFEISQITLNKNSKGIETARTLNIKKNQTSKTIHTLFTKKSSNKKTAPFKIAWMDIPIFEDDSKRKEQDELVKFIIDYKLDSLWLTLNPHMYYSPIAKHPEKKDSFYKSISNLTKKLSAQAKNQKQKPPSILIGFEIVNNIYKPNLPKKAAVDLYGNSYHDVPNPLDRNFWENEVKMPLDNFLKEWNKQKISNNIKLSGVILDLEMYCRETTESFLPTMGFDAELIQKFSNTPIVHSSTQYLLSEKKFSSYFNYLSKQAEKLGTELGQFFKEKIPNGIVGCYSPHISVDWFYKNLYKGICSKQNKFRLLTFNSEFNHHKKWLSKNGITVDHLSVLMMSKIGKPSDFKLASDILERHDGIWLNKFSRMTEKTHNDWSLLEQTPMSMEQRKQAKENFKASTKL